MEVQSKTVRFRCMEKNEMNESGHESLPAASKMSMLKLLRL
jgi:hypothetical protein